MAKNFDLKKGPKKVVDLRKKESFQSKAPSSSGSKIIKKKHISSSKKSASSSFLKRPSSDYSRLKRSPKKKSNPFLKLLIVLLFLLIAAAIAGFLFFYQGGGSSKNSIKLSLATTKSLASGEQAMLKLSYENIDQVTVKELEVIFEYPEGFFFDQADIEPDGPEKNIWYLSDLDPGQSGEIEIAGQLFGKLNEKKEFKIIFYYQPENFNSNFKEELSATINISDVLFEVELETPLEVNQGSEAKFSVDYKNTTAVDMENLTMSFDLGENFTLVEAEPSTTPELIWSFEKIEAQSKGEINLSGNFLESLAGEIPWQFRIWQNILKDNKEEERLLYQEEGIVNIITPSLEANLEFTNQDKLSWGGTLHGELKLKNNGNAKAENLGLKVDFNSSVINWDEYNSKDGVTNEGTALIWPEGKGKLKEFSPEQEETLSFSLPIKNEPENLDLINPEEIMIEALAILSYDFNNERHSIDGQPIIAFLALEPQLISEARYYLDAQTVVGSGPVPPEIGKETTYRIYWKVFSGIKALSGVEIKTSLPPYINWDSVAEEATIGTPLFYDNVTREIIWQIESLTSNTQVLASFDIAVVPDDTQVNQLLILINPTILQAKDSETNDLVSITTNLLTSELLGDPVSQGQGRVIVGQ